MEVSFCCCFFHILKQMYNSTSQYQAMKLWRNECIKEEELDLVRVSDSLKIRTSRGSPFVYCPYVDCTSKVNVPHQLQIVCPLMPDIRVERISHFLSGTIWNRLKSTRGVYRLRKCIWVEMQAKNLFAS